METPTDFLGQEITVGSYVAFPSRHSSSMWLQVGRVTAVQPDSVTVRSIRRRWNDGYEVSSRAGTLTVLRRVVVVPETQIPSDIRNLLQ